MPKIVAFRIRHLIILTALFGASNGQYKDEPCQIENRPGVCIYFKDCLFAQDQLRKRMRPQICSFEDYESIVCCPVRNQTGSGGGEKPKLIQQLERRSIEYCVLVRKKALDPPPKCTGGCGGGGIGGVQASAKEFPHMAALGFGDKNDKQWLCGGTLISEVFVLTAAHCLYSAEYGDVSFVRLGDLNLKSVTDDAIPQDYNVVSIYSHPNYIPPAQYNDIGLVRFDQPAFFNKYVNPACLQTKHDLSATSPIATGWGRLGYAGETSDELMKILLVYYSNKQCRHSYRNVRKDRLPNGITENTQICAGGRKDEIKDTCQGDSGGPLQIITDNNPKQYHVVGVTSAGKACGVKNIPGVYTRVSNYIQWIEDIVWPNSTLL